jgi:hypothetical protein
MEISYPDYIKKVEHILKEETLKEIALKVKTLGKFKKSATDQWEPVPYAGYTMITPTLGSDLENSNTYLRLLELQEILSKSLDLSKIVRAPAKALHMTVARLISGETFEKMLEYSHEFELLTSCTQLFSQITVSRPIEFEIKGLSIFPQGVIGAEVSPRTENDYQMLQTLRDCIYNDQALTDLGVDRKRGFHGHITLFYIEEKLYENDREILASAVTDINRDYFQVALPYYLARAEIRKFDNFLSFYRQDSWPFLKFTSLE